MLPFLLDEAIVARVDLKADRQNARLVVHAVHLESGAPPDAVEALRSELALLARWLGLDEVASGPSDD